MQVLLGKVACRILSALLGVGVAEWSWGASKHLKSRQQSHLGAETTRMRAVFGGACIEKAGALKVEKEQPAELWNDDKLDFQLGLEKFAADDANGVVQAWNPLGLFHAWREDWEDILSKQMTLYKRPSCYISTVD